MSIYSDKLALIQVVINCLYSITQMCICKDTFAHYSDKLAHVQVVINCQYSVAQMCTREDTLARYLGVPSLDDVVSHNELTTIISQFFFNS